MKDPAVRSGPPPDPNHPGDQGIQADAPRLAPRRQPAAEEELILLGDEHIQTAAPASARPTAAPQRATDLIDREFIIDLGRPTAAFVFALLAFAVMGVVSIVVSGAVWPFALVYLTLMVLSFLVYFLRPHMRTLRLTADGVETTHPDDRLEYGDILEIYAPEQTGRAGRNFAIHLLHAQGYCTIPATVQADSEDLLAFLETQPLGARAIPKVAPILRDFLKQQVAVHGADDVYVYRARRTHPPAPAMASSLCVCTTLAIVGIGLTALGIVQRVEALIACGIGLALVMGLLCLLVALQHRLARPPIKNWQQATLIIGPDGLALVQGDLEGELRWRELKKVNLGKGAAGSSTGAQRNARIPGIHLQVAGAGITIADIYHWPLSHALEQIERHWRGRS